MKFKQYESHRNASASPIPCNPLGLLDGQDGNRRKRGRGKIYRLPRYKYSMSETNYAAEYRGPGRTGYRIRRFIREATQRPL